MNSSLVLSTMNLALGGLVLLLGLIILRENPRQRLNRLVATMLFFGSFGAILAGLGFMADRGALGARPAPHAGTELLQSLSYIWEFFFPTLFLFACIFPEERAFVRRSWRVLGRFTPPFEVLVFAPHAFHFVLAVVLSIGTPQVTIPEVGWLRYLAPLAGVVNVILGLFLLVHQALFSLVNLGFGFATMALLFDSYRKTRVPRLKRQLYVITIGLSACLVCYSFATSIPGLLNLQIDETLRSALTIAALTLGPGSIAYSIVRYKFLDAKLLARRGILYALLSAGLVGMYLLVVGRVNQFMSASTGVSSRVFEPVLLIMALALFQPLIARLEEVLDQNMLKDPGDYRNVLRQLGRELQTTIDLDVLLTRTSRTLADAMLLRSAHIVVLAPGGALAHTGVGESPSDATLHRLEELLPRVSSRQTSYRWTDRVEGLTREEQDDLAERLRISLLVPLRWRGDLVGALLLGSKVIGTDFTSEDVTLLTTLGAQVSVSLQNALLLRDRVAVARFEEELNLARQIQRTSLPSEFPEMPRCEAHAMYIPSKHVGGDFYDVVSTGDGSYLVAIADVSGKGVPAALLSSMLQASLRTLAPTNATLPTMLARINTLMYQSTTLNQFATFFLARIDGERLRITYSNAGHNWPVIVRSSGEHVFLERGGTVLGILEDIQFEEAQATLSPGDLLVLYTDGISEATNASTELFGDQRVVEIVERMPRGLSAKEVSERLLASVGEFLGDVEPQDDITLLVLRALEPAPVDVATPRVPEVVAAG